MASKPFYRKIFKTKMGKLAEAAGLEEPEDWFFAQVAEGRSFSAIARELGCSRQFLYSFLNRKDHKERRWEKLTMAREISADAHVEDGMEILEGLASDPDVTAAQVSLGNSRANYRKWLAGIRNRKMYGEEKAEAAVNINLSVGEQHLAALMGRGRPVIDNVQEAEVLAIEDGA